MMAGVPKRATASRNTMIAPPRIEGHTSGRVTLRIAVQVPAPRMLAASSISEDTRSRADFTKMKISGKDWNAMTQARPLNVYTLSRGSVAPVIQRHAWLRKPAFGAGQQDPADRAQIGRQDEAAQDEDPDQGLAGHVGCVRWPRPSEPRRQPRSLPSRRPAPASSTAIPRTAHGHTRRRSCQR